jgi:DNA replication protein DnaC
MTENLLLDTYLRQLRLPAFLQHYRKLAEDALQARLRYDQFLLTLAEQEIAQRETNLQARRIQAARFPVLRDLADFDFPAIPQLNQAQVLELARGGYLAKAEAILLVGNPGLGKTHIATGLALAAARQGHRVRFSNAAGLVNDLLQAQDPGGMPARAYRKQHLPRFLAQSLQQQLIVVDELGFIPLSTLGAQVMFQFCSAVHERVALIVTTHLRFADWISVFQDERLTGALLDRLTSRAHILEFIGDSYRLRQRRQRQAQGELVA